MNKLSHMIFAISLFVGIYSLIYAYSVWRSDLGQLLELLYYYLVGGIAVTIIMVPLLYWKAPNKRGEERTTSNKSSVSALAFVMFCIGSLVGSSIYQIIYHIPIIGNISIFIGMIIMVSGALMPDWDITFLGISHHRNLIFHSFILALLVTVGTLANAFIAIVQFGLSNLGVQVEYYITALFLFGYASHLILDIFPSNASPLEILWRAIDPHDKAPTGLKPLGPIKITQKAAKGWLVGNALILLFFAFLLMGLYFYNLPQITLP